LEKWTSGWYPSCFSSSSSSSSNNSDCGISTCSSSSNNYRQMLQQGDPRPWPSSEAQQRLTKVDATLGEKSNQLTAIITCNSKSRSSLNSKKSITQNIIDDGQRLLVVLPLVVSKEHNINRNSC
jgi:hypothetical protein